VECRDFGLVWVALQHFDCIVWGIVLAHTLQDWSCDFGFSNTNKKPKKTKKHKLQKSTHLSSSNNKNMDRFVAKNSAGFLRVFPKTATQEFGVLDTIGDGSCFFHSVTAATTENYDQLSKADQTKAGRAFRQAFLNKMNEQIYANTLQHVRQTMKAKQSDHILENYDYMQFKQKMANFRSWADAVIISTVAALMRLNLVFFDSTSNKLYYGVDNFAKAKAHNWPTILIEWENRSHFNLIVRKTKLSKAVKIERQFHYAKDSAFLQRLESHYQRAS
jgi:hypothetical protein